MSFLVMGRQWLYSLSKPRHFLYIIFLTLVFIYLVINQENIPCKYLRSGWAVKGKYGSNNKILLPQAKDPAKLTWLCENDFSDIMILPPTHKKTLTYFKCRHLTAPSMMEYNIGTWPTPNDLNKVIWNIFMRVKKGFFIDAYAGDGLTESYTLPLEAHGQWSGILIEPNNTQRRALANLNRKAWISGVCLSPYVGVAQIEQKPSKDTISGMRDKPGIIPPSTLECFPLIAITSALKVKRVNFMVLNLETNTFSVLKTLPYDDTLQVDIILVKHLFGTMSGREIQIFMESKDYFITHSSLLHTIFARKL